MNLYLISRAVPRLSFDDGYDQAVVAAETEADARNMHPLDGNALEPAMDYPNGTKEENDRYWDRYARDHHWVHCPDEVVAVHIGTAVIGINAVVILADLTINE